MKSLKVLACATCLLGTVSGVGLAKDVQTIGGAMVVPNNVNVVSASKANTLALSHLLLQIKKKQIRLVQIL